MLFRGKAINREGLCSSLQFRMKYDMVNRGSNSLLQMHCYRDSVPESYDKCPGKMKIAGFPSGNVCDCGSVDEIQKPIVRYSERT